MVTNLQAIVLAAGKSTRFNTGNTKLVEKLCGQEMILYPTRMLASLNIPTTVVVGYQKNTVRNVIHREHGDTISFVTQEKQRGTGNAIVCARTQWKRNNVLIMYGDTPLVTPEIVERLYARHVAARASISFVTAHNSDPTSNSYDRVIQHDHQVEIVRPQLLR